MAVGGLVVGDTGATTVGSGVSNQQWGLDAEVVIVDTSASGNVSVQGEAFLHTATNTRVPMPIVNTGLSGSLLDWTVDNYMYLSLLWGTADPADTITVVQLEIEELEAP